MSATVGNDFPAAPPAPWLPRRRYDGAAVARAAAIEETMTPDALGAGRGVVFGLLAALACWGAAGGAVWSLLGV